MLMEPLRKVTLHHSSKDVRQKVHPQVYKYTSSFPDYQHSTQLTYHSITHARFHYKRTIQQFQKLYHTYAYDDEKLNI